MDIYKKWHMVLALVCFLSIIYYALVGEIGALAPLGILLVVNIFFFMTR